MSRKWHSGPPPSVGWWPASMFQDESAIRWWDGERWSREAFAHWSKLKAGFQAENEAPDEVQHLIEWTDRPANWPKRSRT